MPKTTLVIHPKDPTTDCLSVIYEGRNWTVIRDSDTPRDIVEEQIRTIINMKKIRIDYYRYRLKKGKADILLQNTEKKDEYCIPHHYVRKNEGIAHSIKHARLEDDGDLVILDVSLNDCKMSMTKREWVPMSRLLELNLTRNESFHIWHNILRYFLDLCPKEGESGNINRARKMLEDVRIRKARKEYIDWLERLLNWHDWLVLDGEVLSQPDPELVRREMETLEHFRILRPQDIIMCQLDNELMENDEYGFEPVSLSVFGCIIEPIGPLFPLGFTESGEE